MSSNHKKQLKKLLINTKFALQDIFKNDFFSKGEHELNNLLKESMDDFMECLLVKKINLLVEEANKTISTTNTLNNVSRNDNAEDAEIANQLYNLHTKILRMFILTAFDMSRDILITPKRILYAKEKENELYEQLMIIAKEKQQEIRLLISSTIEQMRDRLVEKAANYVFKENTIFNLPQPHNSINCLGAVDCTTCHLDCLECRCNEKCQTSSDKCDSALLLQSDEQCSCENDEPDYPQIIIDYNYSDNQCDEDQQLLLNNEQINRQDSTKLRRHHSMHTNGKLNPYLIQPHNCCHHDLIDSSGQQRRAHSQLHNFKPCYQMNCNQVNFNTQSHQNTSLKYTSCDYADSGCASGNCCSCEPLVNSSNDFHHPQHLHPHRNSQLHSNHHTEHNDQLDKSPNKKESFLKRFTLRFNKTDSETVDQQNTDQRVIEQLNELQIKDKQDYEDLKNHLNHLNHLDQLKQQKNQLDYYQSNCSSTKRCNPVNNCCNVYFHHHQPSQNKQIKITLKDLCAAQNEIQEYILSLLNNQIANDIVSSVNILKKNYIGTLERCLTTLESGVSSNGQRDQLTNALTAVVQLDSFQQKPSTTSANNNKLNRHNQLKDRKMNNKKKSVSECQNKDFENEDCSKEQQIIYSSYTSQQQSSLDCDCTLTSKNSTSDEDSSFEEDESELVEESNDYSIINRTHHQASDALKQILTAAYQIEINLKTNSGFFKLYWDKIRQLVFNCTVTLWKLNYANPKNVNGFCSGGCHSNLSLIDTATANNKTSSCNSCPPVICNSVASGTGSNCVSSLDCCELNCCYQMINCDQTDNEQNWMNENMDDESNNFKKSRNISLQSYVNIEHPNQFLDSHCNPNHHAHHKQQMIGIANGKLQFDSIIDWKRKVALEVLSNLNLNRLSKSICGQFKDKLKQSHEQFAQAIRQLEQLHLEKRKRIEQQRLNLRKCFAPKIARFALESICLKDLINHGMPKLGREIGRGQYGVVYSCNQWAGYGPLAVKSVVPPDDKHWNDLAMEFYYTKSIPENDRIVQIRGSIIDYSYGSVLLIMDRLNRDLYTAIKSGLDWLVRLQIAIDVIQGIRFLHSQGLVHRDLKLKNVLLDSNNRAKISDFGFCKTASMISGSIVGTPIHMSSEIFTGKYDQSVDVYAFGILFWYICAGHVRLPYVFEQCQNKDQLWTYVRKGSRPEKLPYFDEECWEIMNHCWKGSPNERPLPGDVELRLHQVLTRYQQAQQQQQQIIQNLNYFRRSNSCNAQHANNRTILNRNLVNSPLNSPTLNSPTLNQSPLLNAPSSCRMNSAYTNGALIQPSCSSTADEQSNLYEQYSQSINVQN